jgi:hypothetical protein
LEKEMRESTIEKKTCDYAKSLGWKTYKFVSPGNKAVPDRIFFRRTICFLIEFKQKGKKPTKLQEKTINDLRKEGFEVFVCDNLEDGIKIINSFEI